MTNAEETTKLVDSQRQVEVDITAAQTNKETSPETKQASFDALA